MSQEKEIPCQCPDGCMVHETEAVDDTKMYDDYIKQKKRDEDNLVRRIARQTKTILDRQLAQQNKDLRGLITKRMENAEKAKEAPKPTAPSFSRIVPQAYYMLDDDFQCKEVKPSNVHVAKEIGPDTYRVILKPQDFKAFTDPLQQQLNDYKKELENLKQQLIIAKTPK
jgi:hypothetical protein